MAILNITSDSFSDDGYLFNGKVRLDRVLEHAETCIAEGASILDVGGESTRPGAVPVSSNEELDRVVPVIEALVSRFDVIISIDTSAPAVMLEAASHGVSLINDVRALSCQGAMDAAFSTGLPVCLMHMQGTPQTMQNDPMYSDLVKDVYKWLMCRVDTCLASGFASEQLILDPGFGFGKTKEHNVHLFRNLAQFVQTNYPVMIGVSRKTMIGEITGRPVEQRATGSAVAAAMAVAQGVAILRVHDVAETRDAISVMQILMQEMQ